MSKPEIARRCPVCGASIREAAFFCPQCGEQLAHQDLEEKPSTSVVTTPLDESATDRNAPTNKQASDAQKLETLGASTPLDELSVDADQARIKEKSDAPKQESLEVSTTFPPETPAEKRPVGKVRGKIQRATTLARDVEGDVKHRVQKVRQISSVVLDEAGYDPSLRFVLVAAALFILFLLVLLLNKLIV
jgi:uncharacterized Zn finger protein (UPF0148 family)